MTQKEWALELVKQFNTRWGPGVWPNIVRGDLADGLRDRINDPDQVNQGNTNLCGVAAFVRDWITQDPVAYAWFGICLFEQGAGRFSRDGKGAKIVRPSDELKNSPLARLTDRNTSRPVNPADWVVLGSLREDLNVSLNYRADESWLFWSDTRGLSSVGDVVKMFQRAGYQQVRDYANWWTRKNAEHLIIAGKYVVARYAVVLFVDYRLLSKAKQDTEALVATANHFIALTSDIEQRNGGSELRFQVYSWGQRQMVPEDSGWMPRKTLERHYYGFVAARY